MKKQLFATLGGTITGFLFGWLAYGILLMDFFTDNSIQYEGLMKEEPGIWGYFLSNLAMAVLLTYIFDKWANIKTFSAGAMNGAFIGGLIVFAYDIQFYASLNWMNGMATIADLIAGTVMYGLTGGVCALILGKVKD